MSQQSAEAATPLPCPLSGQAKPVTVLVPTAIEALKAGLNGDLGQLPERLHSAAGKLRAHFVVPGHPSTRVEDAQKG
jgi:hypothetical protein